MEFHDLAPHIGSLVALISALASLVVFLVWRMLARLEKKLDEVYQFCCDCRPEMLLRFVTKEEFREAREDFHRTLTQHVHSQDGEVIRFITY